MRHLFASAFCVLALAGVARADEPAYTESKAADGSRLIVLKRETVFGQKHEPRVFYVLKRSSVEYPADELEQTFLPRILQATGRHPF